MLKTILAMLAPALVLLAACAAQTPASDDETIIAISPREIAANPASIEGFRYVSTGQPDQNLLTIARSAGIVAIVDLRGADEPRGIDEKAAVEALGMRYVAIPVASVADVTDENAAILDAALAGIDGPVLLHCASGNRVGALFALRARDKGASPDEALEQGRAAGLTRYEAAVRERLNED